MLAAEEEEGGSFLVSPNVGLMIWTLIAFGAAFLILRKYAYPQIDAFLQRRADAIAESLDAAEHAKKEADQLLEEYRARLKEAREQADDIVARRAKGGRLASGGDQGRGQALPRGADGVHAQGHRDRDPPRARARSARRSRTSR